MTQRETAKILAVIGTVYPGKFPAERTAETVAVWHRLIGDLEYGLVDAALQALLQTSSWQPLPADLRRAALELERGPKRTGLEAWGSVMAAMRAKGAYRTPGIDFTFIDPITARAVDAMGWQELCLSENTVADRARFIEAYEAMAQQDQTERRSPVLVAARERRAVSAGQAISSVLASLPLGKDDDGEK